MDFDKQCANCHAPTDNPPGAFGSRACSDGCGQDLSDMLEIVNDTGGYDEIVSRGRTVKCDCTGYCEHCLQAS